ncbi:(RS)-norcoclaurine 6-O-methyltransferase [Vitis vinifera]|uniref:(RS)-norcoclaurine 6-O-methyltransferase n=1 Tax=Vitis vinifera TaxID=29760 RepID=A0A438IJ43_VITVI|nr:(RS)-norcoclaurine 6-O-methyltransferase [Vitis vinifera]
MTEATREMKTLEEEEEAEVGIEMWKYIYGFAEMAAVKCGIELGIADVMESHGGPITLPALSSSLGCPPSGLNRIMRFLVSRRIFKEVATSQGDTGYQQTPMSRCLMTSGGDGMAAFVLLESSPVMLAPWHGLSARVLGKGNSTFEAAHGDDIWGYAAKNPDHSKLINDAMASNARRVVPAMVNDCPEVFDGVSTLVDVGGGNGTALRTLVKACPWIRGINFDLPYVVATAPKCNSVEHVGGNMFDSVPKADAVFIMKVLHDWGDEKCIKILEKCREAIPEDKGKVIIVEAVIEDGDPQGDDQKVKDVKLMIDMVMMAHTTTGKERTFKEWDYVLLNAGFSRYTIKPIRNIVQSIIEAYP